MARPAGFEPATIRLEGGCSIQLSYGRNNKPQKQQPYQAQKSGRSGGIRTPDPLVPNQMRYQAALHSDCFQGRCRPRGAHNTHAPRPRQHYL